jgi:uncharacterized protein YdhG (YjbR/CyaY superfamily)
LSDEPESMHYNPKVDLYLARTDHPLTAEIRKVREIVLSTDDRIEETVKWNSPTFVYHGNMEDIASKEPALRELVMEWIRMQEGEEE